MSNRPTGLGSVAMTVEEDDALEMDWTIMKSLIDAQEHTNASLERYALYATHEDVELDAEHIDDYLAQAIASHEQALEDLRTARDLVAVEGED
jgi:predicted solute-binding protein